MHYLSTNPEDGPTYTTTTMTGLLIAVRIDALELGRHLELDPDRWTDAQAAFRIASRLADVTRLEALR
jgi:hypothetical protein